jgi:mRNA-degrading endonuclease RelE of RelBE toxin-antitoxin system
MKRKWLTVGLILVLTGGAAALLWAEGAGGPAPGAPAGQAGPAKHAGWMQNLTPEQRAQVQAKIQEMKQAGKTPEEIRQAVFEMLKGWGVQLPQGAGAGDKQGPAWMQQLTPEQRAQVLAKHQELKQAGKTPEEIHAAIAEMLKGWGVQMPAGGGRGGWMAQLTPEQQQQVKAKIQEMQQQGKTKQEIHAAVLEMLKGWGIQAPAGGGRGGWMAQLTPEQQQQVKAKIQEMQQQGKTKQEIHAAVLEMLKGWGIEPPAGGQGLGRGGNGLLKQLTPEQRAQVLAKVQEMKDQGKTPQEIRAAVMDMLKGWGVQAPAAAPQPQPAPAGANV